MGMMGQPSSLGTHSNGWGRKQCIKSFRAAMCHYELNFIENWVMKLCGLATQLWKRSWLRRSVFVATVVGDASDEDAGGGEGARDDDDME